MLLAVKCRLCVMLVLLKHLVTSCWRQKEFSIFFKGQINLLPEVRLRFKCSMPERCTRVELRPLEEGVIISVGSVKSGDVFFCKGNTIFWEVHC